ncbi:MAG TPA: Ig-like domain-containing protein [Anaerolineae bacterium]
MLIIALSEKLAFGTTYDFTLDKTAADENGVRLARPYQWSYRLKDTLAGVEWPTASDPQAPIKLRFNYALNRNSAENALSFEPFMEGRLTWNGNNTVATFQPGGRLPANTDYTLTFSSALRSGDGEELPLPAPVTFTTPPPILATLPTGEAANPAGHIEVRFDRPMDEISTEAAFHTTPEISGQFEWRETTLLFQPDEDYLVENTRYTVTIEPQAAGADGEPILDEPYSWTFKTGQLQDLADFGYGPNAQVLDVNGRRAVQFQAFNRAPAGLQFELYRLNLNQFLDRYASGFRGWQGWEEQPAPISSEGTELVKRWRVETTKPLQEWTNVQEVIIPEDVAPGLYILNLVAGRVNDQLILVLTENTLTVKQAEGQIVAWVTDINGDIVHGIDVGVYARDGSLLGSGQAAASGIFRTTIPPYEEGGPASIEPLIVVAGSGNDITVSGLAPEWSNSSGWGNWWLPTPAGLDSAAFVYTDRPIYKPGQTVYFKAIVRRDDDALLTLLPAGTAVTVRIRDARDNVVQTIELTTNDFGSVDGSFQLAEGAMLGRWNVEVVVNGDSHRQVFKVEDYRKPDYEVRVTTDVERYVLGDTMEVTVDTNYFFGEPVPNASIQIKRFVLSQNYYGYESSSDYTWYETYDSQSIAGKTDENGRFTTTIAVTPESYASNWNEWESNLVQASWGIEATVDDGSHQTVSGFAVVHIFNASEEIRLDTGSYVQEPGKPFTVKAEVVTIFGEPVASRNLTLELRRWSSGSYGYRTIVQSTGLTTGEDGRASVAFTIEQPGYYQVRVSGKDARGLDIAYTSWIYAFSDFYNDWYGRNSESLGVVADQQGYAPGDTARLMVESSFSGPALLTIERGTIRRERLVQLNAPLTIVEVPIEAGDVPNVYVAVNAWQEQDTTLTPDVYNSLPDSRLHTAYVNLSVPATTKVLNVAITPDRDVYAPRDEATFTVRVTNYQDVPISAEVSLALVDEAIFALSEELAGPMYDAFYYERASIVRTYNSMNLVRYLGGGMGGGGGGGEVSASPRADFPDTAAWFPTLYTDFNGEVKVTVTLPDSLTSWRLTAKATTADTQVGEAIANVLTQQPIVIRPILPRVLTAGDTVQLSAVVHNYSDTEQRIAVSIEEIGDWRLEIERPVSQTITVASGELRVVGWSAVVKAAGESELLLTASPVGGDVRGDAVQLPLSIQPLAVPDVTTQVGQVSDRTELTVTIPEDALEMSHVEVQLSRSIAGSLLEGLDYLTGFPYGCVEQTMSKALPNAVVGRALHQLGVTNPTLQAELPAQINASVQRLYGFQHNDGGWGWWYDDQTDAYQTAWVIFGLGTTAEAGYEIDPAVIERGVAWLNENLNRMDNRTRAFALYSMAVAGQPNREMMLALADQADQLNLDTFSQAALALTLHKLGDTAQARAIVDALAETAVVSNGRAYWSGQSGDGSYDRKTMASATRNTAIALSAFSTIRPGHDLEDDIVRWLMAQRRQYGWGTTNETAFAIVGLTDHLLATSFSEAAADSHYNVMLNGVVIATGTFRRGQPATTLQIPREQLAAGNNTLVLEQSGGRQLYYVVNSRVYLAQEEIEAAGNIRVTRTYLDPETNKPVERITAGQLVKVSLQVVTPGSGSYMMVEDKLPGGLEALNEGLNTTSHIANAYEEPYYWQDYGYNNKEVRGDRVSFFITEMNSGSHTFTYFARATHAGRFTAMPTEVSAMYDLSLWGRSASNNLVIE